MAACTSPDDNSCFVIAEAGVNHNGDLDTARRLVDVAVEAGADAVKFQTFKADKLVTRNADKADYQKKTTDAGESQYDMLHRLELSEEDHQALLEHCHAQNILFMSTPFDEDSADFLEELGVPIIKLGSGEVTNLPFLRHVAQKDLPIILSTGMSYLGEVEEAVRTIEETGPTNLSLLHCVSQYPAAPKDANLRAMETLRQSFGYPVGYSDHTLGIEIPVAAVALGAQIIEKHFTLDRTMEGPDHRASLEPAELAAMVQAIRNVESALGDGRKRPVAAEADVARVARKSLVTRRTIEPDEEITQEDLSVRRPGTGIAPKHLDLVTARRAALLIEKGTVLTWEHLT